jgi:hypothetical protein
MEKTRMRRDPCLSTSRPTIGIDTAVVATRIIVHRLTWERVQPNSSVNGNMKRPSDANANGPVPVEMHNIEAATTHQP